MTFSLPSTSSFRLKLNTGDADTDSCFNLQKSFKIVFRDLIIFYSQRQIALASVAQFPVILTE